jgi:hypothetical protein
MRCISAARIATIGLVGTALVLGACSSRELIVECQDAAGLHVVCDLQNPEDLALLSDGRTLIMSQFGSMSHDRPGSIALLDLETEAVRVVHPVDGDEGALQPTPGWGDPECPGPAGAAFNPHGIDLAHRPDGRLQLLVVNHGGRESIEIFEVDESASPAEVHWRGCVVAGYELYINDVVHVPEGGFLVTHMMDRESSNWDLLRASIGLDTGRVYSWRPVRGFEPVPGTDAPFPNGIELSPDGRTIYLNVYLPGEVRRIDRASGELLAGTKVPSPDNSSWGRDGRLLVASHRGGFSDMRLCIDVYSGACPMPFAILALDPETLEAETLFEHEGPPMGGGTVAIDTGSELLIGSFAADRLLRVPHSVR